MSCLCVSCVSCGVCAGIQLKILSAVKTASEGVDSTTEGQLVTCGKGLASAVIALIDTAEVGDLKRTFA